MKTTIKAVLVILALNAAVTCGIDAFKHPTLTSTQRFLRIPQVFFFDFKLEK